jgi:hypothetical protein
VNDERVAKAGGEGLMMQWLEGLEEEEEERRKGAFEKIAFLPTPNMVAMGERQVVEIFASANASRTATPVPLPPPPPQKPQHRIATTSSSFFGL